MATEIAIPPEVEKASVRAALVSYDTGYEHSIEHLAEVRRIVQEEHEAFFAASVPPTQALRGILLDLKAS